MKAYQMKIAQSLKNTATELGELYEGAVEMLKNKQFPGRGRFIAHAVREIANRLPEAVGAEVTKGRLDYHKEISSIAVVWKNEGLGNTVVARSGEEDEVGLRISQRLAAKVNTLFEKDERVSTQRRENAAELIRKLIPESRNSVDNLCWFSRNWTTAIVGQAGRWPA